MSVSTPAPQGRLSPVEWATIVATCITIVTSIGTIAYMSGSYGNRIDTIAEATKNVPVEIQALKSNLIYLQEIKAKVEEIQNIKERVAVLESKRKL